ncbi:MAG TPA: hypothetical protein VKY19_25535 [Ktedonosporobacter sp.]|jgi:hypothetical protein|nr:hypothetical protein [Ktedonosporobacter sp.]
MKQQDSTGTVGAWHKITEKETPDISALTIAFEHFATCVDNRAGTDDLEILSFCLQHLFYSVDALYQVALPELATHEGQEQESTPQQRYRVWLLLREIKSSLERLKLLCRLLNGAITSILDTLDMAGTQSVSAEIELDESDPAYARLWQEAIALEQWEQAFSALTAHLRGWHTYCGEGQPFTSHFSHLSAAIPALVQANAAFALLLENACSIFEDILPGFRAIPLGDDEVLATVSLDLMQKADQIYLQGNTLLEPLCYLIKQYAAP